MSHGDDVHDVGTDAVDDKERKSPDRQLPRGGTTACAAVRELLDNLEGL